jgi:2-polyprenyl-3-methyl-5-hydroxy-6-metoxy-1,4-benzoquinol methylase
MGLFSEFFSRAAYVARSRIRVVSRKLSTARGLPVRQGFFDEYTRFSRTSKTRASTNRLNERYRACIEWNGMAIRGKRILDLASHDGRWSFAAMKAGATSVVGIEGRDHLVQAAGANLREYGVPEKSFRFILGDVLEEIDQIEPHSVDTVFCFNFLYHVADQMLLLSKIARLKPKYLILDTMINHDPRPIILLKSEDLEYEGAAVRFGEDAPKVILSGMPSKAALELMLSSFGWSFEYYNWHQAGIRRWDFIEEYHGGWCVTVRVVCAP